MNILSDAINARQAGFDEAQNLRDRYTRNRTGAAMASGNLDQAAETAYRGGDLQLGSAVQGMQRQAQDRASEQDAATKAAEVEHQKQLYASMVKIGTGLKSVPPGQRAQKLQQLEPWFQSVGMGEAGKQIASLPEDQLTDENIDVFTGQMEKAAEQFTLTPGSKRYDAEGNLVAEAPFAPQYKTVGEGQSLVAVGADGSPVPGAGAVPGGVQEAVQRLTGMGAKITSAQRTPQHNAEVGGAKNSYHLKGQAYDIVPPAGMTMAQLEDGLRQVPGVVELLNEGDHVHVAWAGDSGGGPAGARVIAQGSPKPQERWEDLPGGGQRNTVTGETKNVPKSSGRLSSTVVKMQNDLLTDLGTASQVNTLLDRSIDQIKSGKLNLSLGNNVLSQAANFTGMSTEASRNFASFKASLNKLRNDSLRLNKGVQTEGDAQRAWDELINNTNDPNVVLQRLTEIKDINEQAMALRSDLVNQARQDSGFEPIDTTKFQAAPAGSGGRRQQTASPGPRPPKVGAVVKGYRFNGGDPANPKSWTKVQ